MQLVLTISLPALALVIGCHSSVMVEGTAVAGGQASSSVTSGGAGGAPLAPQATSSSGVGGAPVSVTAAESSGNGGSPALQSSAIAGGGGGGDSTSVTATSASSGGVGGSPVEKSSAVSTGADGAGGAGVTGGAGGSGAGGAAAGTGGAQPFSCSLCSDVINNFASPDTLCRGSVIPYLAVVKCACDDACAPVCAVAGSTDCLATMAGNTPPDCAACLASVGGCLTIWDACVGDDGLNTTLSGNDTPP